MAMDYKNHMGQDPTQFLSAAAKSKVLGMACHSIFKHCYFFGQSSSSSPYKCFFRPLSVLASGEVSRVAIGFKAV